MKVVTTGTHFLAFSHLSENQNTSNILRDTDRLLDVPDKTETLLTGLTCDVCQQCGELAFIPEK